MSADARPRSRWHLIAGPTGAGKTTVARTKPGVLFSIDEWMTNLYWMDCPEKNDYPWAIERVRRCEAQIASVAMQLASIGVDVVLDLGFTQREQRQKWLQLARDAGAMPLIETIEPPAELRWQRVCERNEGASETYSFAVTREMFDTMEKLWERVDAEELAAFDAVRDEVQAARL